MVLVFRLATVAVGVLFGVMTVAGGSEGIRVEITADQRVTISGHSNSLRQVIDELCWKAGVDLVYAAPDHAFGAEIDSLYLEDALSRLLRGKNYVVELGPGTAGRSRVRTVRVLGPRGETDAVRTLRVRPETRPSLRVPTRILDAAFGGEDSEDRAAALHELLQTIRSDPDRLRAFLTSDPAEIGEALRRYPHAPAVLRQLISLPGLEEDARAQVAAILAVLE